MIAMFFKRPNGCMAAAIVETAKRDEIIAWHKSEGFVLVRERAWDSEKWDYAQ